MTADENRFQDFISEMAALILESRPQGLTEITHDDYLDVRKFVLDDLLQRGEIAASRPNFDGSDAGLFALLEYAVEQGTPHILLTVQATGYIRVLRWRGHDGDVITIPCEDEAQGNRVADRYQALTAIRRVL